MANGCIFPHYLEFYSSNLSKNCFSECPEECESIKFDFTISQSDYPSPYYGKVLLKHFKEFKKIAAFDDINKIKESILAVNIFYEDISYTEIHEIPVKSFSQLVSDIGGILGLYVGCSLLSLVEILELIMEIFMICIRKK